MTGMPAARYWIFDMDGTLTVPVHDFPAMRRELELPEGVGMIEAISGLPEPLRSERHARLDAIGMRYARMARAQEGARALLEALAGAGCSLGLLTRNSREATVETLAATGLQDLFPPEVVLTRDDPPPKPSAEPLLRLLGGWGGDAREAVMVGDAVYDLQCGRAAGAATLLVDATGDSPLRAQADACVTGMEELLARVVGQLA